MRALSHQTMSKFHSSVVGLDFEVDVDPMVYGLTLGWKF